MISKNRLVLAGVLALASLVVMTSRTRATVTTFQDGVGGYTGTEDAFIDGTTGNQTTSFGANTALFLYEREVFNPVTDLRENRVLMRFDLSSLQPLLLGQMITSATLTITSQGYQGFGTKGMANSLFRVAAVDGAWTEAQATWQRLNASTTWAGGPGLVSGTDYVATALDTQNTPNIAGAGPSNGSTMTFTLNDLSFLPGWINDPSSNAGFFLRQPGVNTQGFDKFYSSEVATVSFRPLLTITTVVPEPATLGLLGAGALIALRRSRPRI